MMVAAEAAARRVRRMAVMVEVQVQLCPEGGGECGGGAVVVLIEGGWGESRAA